jgi:hypothetical protein
MVAKVLAGLLACTSVVLAGCGTLPDATPFADATVSLATSVRASGKAITDSMGEAGSVVPGDKAAYDKLIAKFDAAWSVRIAAAQGAVAYSEAIVGLVAAGNQGGETAGKAADSLKVLAESAGIPVAAPAIGVAGDLARFLGQRIAIVRASDSLETALASAQPAVDRVAEHIVHETEAQLKPILTQVHKNIASGIKEPYDGDADFDGQLQKRREQVRELVLKDQTQLPKLEEFDRSQARVAAALAERDRKLDQAAAAYKARLALLNALSSATLAWAQAHRDLAVAVREKRKVSVTELLATIDELKALTRKVREL